MMKKLLLTIVLALMAMNCRAPVMKIEDFYLRARQIKEMQRELKKQMEIQRILWTIRIIESGSDYFARGGSREFGAYQFTPGTWKIMSKRYYGKLLDITNPKHQDDVAYAWVRDLLSQGFNSKEIASIWNSGSPVWNGKIGINRYGVKYNVPQHVKKFETTYNRAFPASML